MTYVQVYICIFSILFWLTLVDKNIADYLILNLKWLRVNYERLKWLIVYHPNNFVTNWMMERKYSKLAEELIKDLQQKQS